MKHSFSYNANKTLLCDDFEWLAGVLNDDDKMQQQKSNYPEDAETLDQLKRDYGTLPPVCKNVDKFRNATVQFYEDTYEGTYEQYYGEYTYDSAAYSDEYYNENYDSTYYDSTDYEYYEITELEKELGMQPSDFQDLIQDHIRAETKLDLSLLKFAPKLGHMYLNEKCRTDDIAIKSVVQIMTSFFFMRDFLKHDIPDYAKEGVKEADLALKDTYAKLGEVPEVRGHADEQPLTGPARR